MVVMSRYEEGEMGLIALLSRNLTKAKLNVNISTTAAQILESTYSYQESHPGLLLLLLLFTLAVEKLLRYFNILFMHL